MTVTEQIAEEIAARPEQINGITHGRVTFVVQDGRLVRVETQDGWIPRVKEPRPAASRSR